MKNSVIPCRAKSVGFTLVEIMIVVLIIGILLAIAIPNFVAARETSRAKACVANLKSIDSATQQWCMDQKISDATYAPGPLFTNDATHGIIGTDLYIRTMPVCPSSGTYVIAPTMETEPTCSISNPGSGDYATGGKYYHGL